MFEDIERLKMWSKYVQELDDISGVRATPLYEFLEDLEKTVKNPDTEWIDVRSPLDGVLVGFLIVGTKKQLSSRCGLLHTRSIYPSGLETKRNYVVSGREFCQKT